MCPKNLSGAHDYHMSDEKIWSDYWHINFNVKGHEPAIEIYRNPWRADWEVYTTE